MTFITGRSTKMAQVSQHAKSIMAWLISSESKANKTKTIIKPQLAKANLSKK